MDKISDLLKVNENKIYLDGSDRIDWDRLEKEIKSDPSLKSVGEKNVNLVLLSLKKWFINEHWAYPGAFPDIQK